MPEAFADSALDEHVSGRLQADVQTEPSAVSGDATAAGSIARSARAECSA